MALPLPQLRINKPIFREVDVRMHRWNWDPNPDKCIFFQGHRAPGWRHGVLLLLAVILLYPISPLLHLLKHKNSESAFRGMGLFLSLSHFPVLSVVLGCD